MNENEKRIEIPQRVIESLARAIYPKMIAFFQSPEGRQEYEDWKRSQNQTDKTL